MSKKPEMPQSFRFTFSEDDYWRIYEPTHNRHASFFARKPADIYWKMALVALALAPLLFFLLPHIYQFLTAIDVFFAVFFIVAGIILSLKADIPLGNIKKYYDYIEGGISIKVSAATISFETKRETRIVNGYQIKEARFHGNFLEFSFYEGPSVIIPITPSCKSTAEELKQAVESLAVSFWERSVPNAAAAPGNP
jgi:hypothetical protein